MILTTCLHVFSWVFVSYSSFPSLPGELEAALVFLAPSVVSVMIDVRVRPQRSKFTSPSLGTSERPFIFLFSAEPNEAGSRVLVAPATFLQFL